MFSSIKNIIFNQKKDIEKIKLKEFKYFFHKKPNTNGSIKINNNLFYYHDANSFAVTYKEIFLREIYKFKTKLKEPIIIDCGANMGLSVLYFANNYPNAVINAFEPEPEIFEVLNKNITSANLKNVTAHLNAIWKEATSLEFYTDKGMGGSIANNFKDQLPRKVQALDINTFLNQPVSLLKLDIEGAEVEVLKRAKTQLHLIENIFIEYHSFINKEQHLEEILDTFKQAGFRYHLSESFSRKKPFVDDTLICENMDMAINIYAYKH